MKHTDKTRHHLRVLEEELSNATHTFLGKRSELLDQGASKTAQGSLEEELKSMESELALP